MLRVRFVRQAIVAAPLLAAAPAEAEITVAVARITEGSLWVIGQTDEPEVEVTLDGAFTEKADRRGYFRFRVVHHPPDCIVRLRSASQVQEAVVANCGQAGPPGPPGPPGAAGPRRAARCRRPVWTAGPSRPGRPRRCAGAGRSGRPARRRRIGAARTGPCACRRPARRPGSAAGRGPVSYSAATLYDRA